MKLGIIALILLISLTGCAPTGRYTTDTRTSPRSRYYRTGRLPESIPPSGETYVTGKTYKWVASYYADDFHGKKTANGEIFDMYALTCAHRELPFGTLLEVTNPVDMSSVRVRVNDRGPFVRGRDLDLSKGAATQIGMLEMGVKKLHVKIVHLP